MKKSLLSFLLLLIFSSLFTSIVFAGDPIPGVDVGVGKNPGGQLAANIMTDSSGKFSISLKKGKYDITLPAYSEILKIVKSLDKNSDTNKNGYEITLKLDGGKGVTIKNNKPDTAILINKETGAITINITGKTGTISGTLEFAIKENGAK